MDTTAQRLDGGGAADRRDSRVDLLRGIALLCIFFDHIPGNSMSTITLCGLGFSDAAEIFVLLAGFSSTLAYGRLFERHGLGPGVRRIAARCLTIYGVHIALLLATLLVLVTRTAISGVQPTMLKPIIDDGWSGLMRGITLRALPAYLDILPLYLVLLVGFPLAYHGMRRSMRATLGASAAIYVAANALRLNLPNHVDALSATTWTFNPLTWQLVYVCGIAFAMTRESKAFTEPSEMLRSTCWGYIVFALLLTGFSEDLRASFRSVLPASLFGNDPKCFVTPWRLLHVLGLVYLALTSSRFLAIARWPGLQPIVACGRHSLSIFATGCLLALLGRIVFRDVGNTPLVQVAVNVVGVYVMAELALALDRRKGRRRAAGLGRLTPVIAEAPSS